jgi:hypothetical protein
MGSEGRFCFRVRLSHKGCPRPDQARRRRAARFEESSSAWKGPPLVRESPRRDTARAMSQENVETLREVIAVFNRGDSPEAEDLFDPEGPEAEKLFDPEVRIEPLLAGGVEGAVYRGRAGAAEFVLQLNQIFAEVHADYSRIEEFGEVLLVSGKTTGRGRRGSVPAEQPWFSAIRFRRGKITYAAFERTRAEALKAAGITE